MFPLGSSLKGRRVLITGASLGIGAATAERLAAEGAIVGIHYYRHADEAHALNEKINNAQGQAFTLSADLLQRESWKLLIEQTVEKLGGLDALVNNAGMIVNPSPILEISPDNWERSFTLNTEAPFFLAQNAFAFMKDHTGGKIINVSSIGVKYGGSPTSLHYAAAKAALETVTNGLAKAGAPHHILVNTIRPGVIATSQWTQVAPEIFEKRKQLIPLRRAGLPVDVANMILFLLAATGDYITGQIFSITGGD